MTVSDFACAMYGCDIVKDTVMVMRDDKVIYNDRMEFLRYGYELKDPNMKFTAETIQRVSIVADGNARELKKLGLCPDYITVIVI